MVAGLDYRGLNNCQDYFGGIPYYNNGPQNPIPFIKAPYITTPTSAAVPHVQGKRTGQAMMDRWTKAQSSKVRLLASTWRFMGSYKWGYKPPNMGYKCSYPTYNYP